MTQIIINGFIQGVTISTLALGFAIVYVPTKVFFIALGAIYALIPFITMTLQNLGWHFSLAIILAILVGVVVSLLCEFLNHYPLNQRQASSAIHLISSLGIYIIIIQVIALIWGDDVRALRIGIDGIVRGGNVIITHAQLVTLVVSITLLSLFFVWLQHTRLGLQFRALADNSREFALRGYNVRRFRLLAFGMSGVLCAVSALVTAYDIGFDPYVGFNDVLQAIVAVIIGGRDSFVGPIIGGIILGLIRSCVVWFLSANWEAMVTFLVLAVFLYVRPQGIVGRKVRVESTQ